MRARRQAEGCLAASTPVLFAQSRLGEGRESRWRRKSAAPSFASSRTSARYETCPRPEAAPSCSSGWFCDGHTGESLDARLLRDASDLRIGIDLNIYVTDEPLRASARKGR